MCVWLNGKESTRQSRRLGFYRWFGKIPWSRKWQPTPVFLPGKSRGKRSLAGYSPVSSVAQSYQLFATPWTAAQQASLSITSSWSLLKLMSIEWVMPPTISSSVVPFSSCPQFFPASGSFQMSQLSASGGQSIRVSASTSLQ